MFGRVLGFRVWGLGFPTSVLLGTMSPYPMVVMVVMAQYTHVMYWRKLKLKAKVESGFITF
jgi:hypothetical protein